MKRFDKIIKGFTKTITKLEKLSDTCKMRMVDISGQVATLENEKLIQDAEGRAADTVAEKLKELIGQ